MREDYTLKKLFENFPGGICVPRIQRGYVQGRVDEKGNEIEKYIKFAIDLVNAVFGKEEQRISLDFIYGVSRSDFGKKSLLPLDGQQRLSTLCLLAWLCGKWENEWIFTYESRRIPQLFVKGLLEHPCRKGKPSEEIEDAGWFLPIWKDDPSVAGMLRMLDTLHEVIGERNKADADFGHVTFLLHGIEGHSDTFDHIFRKMNARGKELSPWENMKAMLDKYVPQNFPIDWRDKIDGDWADCIWKHADEKIVKLDNAMEKIVRMAYVRFVSCCESSTPDNRHRFAVEAQKDSLWEMEKIIEAEKENASTWLLETFYQTMADYFNALPTISECWTDNRGQNSLWGADQKDENEIRFWIWLSDGQSASAADLLRMAFLAEKEHEGVEDDQRRHRILLNLLDASSINKENFAKALDAGLGFLAGKMDLEEDLETIKLSKAGFSPEQLEDEIRKCGIDDNEIVIFEKDELVYRGSLRFIGWSSFENNNNIATRLNVIRNLIKGDKWLDFYQNLVSLIPEKEFNGRYIYTPLKPNDTGDWKEKILTDGRFIDALKYWHDAPDNHPNPPEWMLHLADLLREKKVEVPTLRCWDGRMFLLQTSRNRSGNSIRLDFNEFERNNRSLLKGKQVYYASSWPWNEAEENGIWYNVCDPSWWGSYAPSKYIQEAPGKFRLETPPVDG